MATFEFTVFEKVPGTACTYAGTTVTKTATTFAEALAALTASHPQHHVAKHLKGLWKEVPSPT